MTIDRLSFIGKKFNRLLILSISVVSKNNKDRIKCECLCDCGKTKILDFYKVKSNWTKSCGCIKTEMLLKRNKTNIKIKHGFNPRYKMKPEYRAWAHMKERCSNPKCQEYKNYGGRGIKVCERWNIFENFIKDMGLKPDKKLSIDRINNDGNYEPGNCRWTDSVTQALNKRKRLKKCVDK